MTLVWKLLRRHMSVAQFAGFALANLFGTLIVLLGYQMYRDLLPVFTAEDSFMRSDYLIVSKRLGAGAALSGRPGSFSDGEVEDLASQGFATRVGRFTSTEYKASARMGIDDVPVLSSEIFLESVPDEFVDVPLKEWKYAEGSREVPIILPRDYINMYNFGFAQSHSLPRISDGLAGAIDFRIDVHGNGHQDEFKGRVIGFSSRANTILVPEGFMLWANGRYAPGSHSDPSRLIMEVANPTDEAIMEYLEENGYETDQDKLRGGKTAYFLKLMMSVVIVIGLVISVLSFYILMLSIFLLVQKNTAKLESLLLIGYGPLRVAMPYGLLTLALNAAVLALALVAVALARRYYMGVIEGLFPQVEDQTMLPSATLGLVLFVLVLALNHAAIYHRIMGIWHGKG